MKVQKTTLLLQFFISFGLKSCLELYFYLYYICLVILIDIYEKMKEKFIMNNI
jgi:hypothetical protein